MRSETLTKTGEKMTDTEDPISWPLAQKVERFVDIVFGGKHHLRKLEVNEMWAIAVPHGSMATIDGNKLTNAVFAAHELGLRVDIENHGMRGIRLQLHSRSIRSGCIARRHPTIIEALNSYGVEVVAKAEHDEEVAKLLDCLRELHDFGDEGKWGQYAKRSAKAYLAAVKLLKQYGK